MAALQQLAASPDYDLAKPPPPPLPPSPPPPAAHVQQLRKQTYSNSTTGGEQQQRHHRRLQACITGQASSSMAPAAEGVCWRGSSSCCVAMALVASCRHGDWMDFTRYQEYRYLLGVAMAASVVLAFAALALSACSSLVSSAQ